MSLAGECHLRGSSAFGVDGKYATGRSPEKPVRTAALSPELERKQKWTLVPVNGSEEVYGIFWNDHDMGPSPLGWSYRGNRPIPEEPIVLSSDTDGHVAWRLQKRHVPGVEHAYTFIADKSPVGVTLYASIHHQTGWAWFKAIPIGAEIELTKVPYWVVIKQ